MQWLSSPPLDIPPPSPFHHCLDGWSAATRCAAFDISTSSWHPATSFAQTHIWFSQSFHLIQYIHCTCIFFSMLLPPPWIPWIAPIDGMPDVCSSQASCMSSLRVKNLCWIPSILPASYAPSTSPVDTFRSSGQFGHHGCVLVRWAWYWYGPGNSSAIQGSQASGVLLSDRRTGFTFSAMHL